MQLREISTPDRLYRLEDVLRMCVVMSGREAFGPNLRRLRVQRGISLQQVAEQTNVSPVLWAGMERNDFSRWPNGIFARAFVREYAKIIGADPDITVDEFCRWFPQGDRRACGQLRGQAEIVNHTLEIKNELPADVEEDRRWSPEKDADATAPKDAAQRANVFGRLRKAFNRA